MYIIGGTLTFTPPSVGLNVVIINPPGSGKVSVVTGIAGGLAITPIAALVITMQAGVITEPNPPILPASKAVWLNDWRQVVGFQKGVTQVLAQVTNLGVANGLGETLLLRADSAGAASGVLTSAIVLGPGTAVTVNISYQPAGTENGIGFYSVQGYERPLEASEELAQP